MTTEPPDPAMLEAWKDHSLDIDADENPSLFKSYRAGWQARDQATCEWKRDDDGHYETQCGHCIYWEDFVPPELLYCGGCGRRWKIKSEQEEQR